MEKQYYGVIQFGSKEDFEEFKKKNENIMIKGYSDYEYRHKSTIDDIEFGIYSLIDYGEITEEEASKIPVNKIVSELLESDFSHYSDSISELLLEEVKNNRKAS